jgi:ABC-type uncharacterized transport system, permease component
MTDILKYLSVYWDYFKQYWRTRLVYRWDFFLGATGQTVNVFAKLAFLTLIFTQVNSLQGWSFNEMLFLAGFSGLVLFTHNVFMFNIYTLGEDYILTGDLDRYLVRPLNPLFQIYSDDVHDNNVPKVIANAALVAYASVQLGLVLTPLQLVYAAASFVSGILVVASIYLAFSSTAFWTGTSKNAIWLVFRISDFRRYPIGIFAVFVQALLVTAVPLAFASFFPASFLLGRDAYMEWQLLSPFAGPVLFALSYAFWKKGLSGYSSTGS